MPLQVNTWEAGATSWGLQVHESFWSSLIVFSGCAVWCRILLKNVCLPWVIEKIKSFNICVNNGDNSYILKKDMKYQVVFAALISQNYQCSWNFVCMAVELSFRILYSHWSVCGSLPEHWQSFFYLKLFLELSGKIVFSTPRTTFNEGSQEFNAANYHLTLSIN